MWKSELVLIDLNCSKIRRSGVRTLAIALSSTRWVCLAQVAKIGGASLDMSPPCSSVKFPPVLWLFECPLFGHCDILTLLIHTSCSLQGISLSYRDSWVLTCSYICSRKCVYWHRGQACLNQIQTAPKSGAWYCWQLFFLRQLFLYILWQFLLQVDSRQGLVFTIIHIIFFSPIKGPHQGISATLFTFAPACFEVICPGCAHNISRKPSDEIELTQAASTSSDAARADLSCLACRRSFGYEFRRVVEDQSIRKLWCRIQTYWCGQFKQTRSESALFCVSPWQQLLRFCNPRSRYQGRLLWTFFVWRLCYLSLWRTKQCFLSCFHPNGH